METDGRITVRVLDLCEGVQRRYRPLNDSTAISFSYLRKSFS
jgi:hypothetical protein